MLLHAPLPERILVWRLKGTGLEHLGTASAPDEVKFPATGEDDVICRVEAVGICYSDVKLVRAGAEHPRMRGRNLAEQPTAPGHEVCLTVVGVGDRWRGVVELGQRYVLQPDVYHRGRSIAVGYQIPGALAEYVVFGPEVLAGDEGCYLLPIPADLDAVSAALVEPWTCVVASRQIQARAHLIDGGDLTVYGFPGQPRLTFSGLRFGERSIRLGLAAPAVATGAPRRVRWAGLDPANQRALRQWAEQRGVSAEALGGAVLQRPIGGDDIVIAGAPPDLRWLRRLSDVANRDAVVGLHGADWPQVVPVDVGRVHYQGLRLVGSVDGDLAASYASAGRQGLRPGGNAWFLGGGGPMGQMHVLLALADPQPPAQVVVTDLSAQRLAALGARAAALRLPPPVLIDASTGASAGASTGAQQLSRQLAALAPGGFDDIVALAPSAAPVAAAADLLAADGYLNVFAGIAEGSFVDLPAALFTRGTARVAGTTGSTLAAMRDTLELVRSGRVQPAIVLAALADMSGGRDAIAAVAEQRFTGKVVLLPFERRRIGLQTLAALAEQQPAFGAALTDRRHWSAAAARAFAQTDATDPTDPTDATATTDATPHC